MKWKCHFIDIKSEYPQGNTIQRKIFLKSPKEYEGKLWGLNKTVYGPCDSANKTVYGPCDTVSTRGTEGKITRGDGVHLYINWLRKTNKGIKVFVTDLLKDGNL